MYYCLMCPVCEMAQRRMVTTINFIEAMYKTEALNGLVHRQDNISDEFWKQIIYWDLIKGNDTTFQHDFVDRLIEDDTVWKYTGAKKFTELFVNALDLQHKERIIWIVSW